jgi:membrane protein DedA with SNARE-associated domain
LKRRALEGITVREVSLLGPFATAFFIPHGYAVLFIWVLSVQLGVPLPTAPLLLAVGAVAHAGQLDLGVSVVLAVAASMAGHLAWYEAGRLKGAKVLRLVCKISLEPDSCVRNTENLFARWGAKTLVAAPFVPGLSAVAQPLAGMTHMPLGRFVLYDSLGSLLWAGGYMGLGYLFSAQLQMILQATTRVAGTGAVAAVLLVTVWVLVKLIGRRRLIQEHRIARITPQELKRKLDAGEPVTVLDLRHELDFASDPHIIQGALRMPAEELERRHLEIPRDREVVLYCT